MDVLKNHGNDLSLHQLLGVVFQNSLSYSATIKEYAKQIAEQLTAHDAFATHSRSLDMNFASLIRSPRDLCTRPSHRQAPLRWERHYGFW